MNTMKEHYLISENGEHRRISGDQPPGKELVAGAERQAKTQGRGLYLVRAEGTPGQVKLHMLQALNDPKVSFEVAAQKFYDKNNGGRPGNHSNRSIFHN